MYIEMVVMTPTKMTPDGILSLGGQIPDLRLVLIFFLSPLILMVLYLMNNENFNEITAVPTKEVAGGKQGQQPGEFCLTI